MNTLFRIFEISCAIILVAVLMWALWFTLIHGGTIEFPK